MKGSISKELSILVQSVKIVFGETNSESLRELLQDPSLDWDKVWSLLQYHKIRPLFSDAARRANFKNAVTSKCDQFALEQSLLHLLVSKELEQLLAKFRSEGVSILPYKGLLFLKEIYQNKSLRESGDVDLVVNPDDALKAINILLAEGFIITEKYEGVEFNLPKIVAHAQGRQLSLEKLILGGNKLAIDFHWGVNEDYHLYQISTSDFFEQAEYVTFNNNEVLWPSKEAILAMILNHNGGRECWTRLKDVVDLFAYIQTFPEVDREALALSWKMSNVLRQGESLINAIFLQKTQVSSSHRSYIKYWEKASRDWVMPKLKFVKLYHSLQDGNPGWIRIGWQFFKHFKRKYFDTDLYGYPFQGKIPFINVLTRGIRQLS